MYQISLKVYLVCFQSSYLALILPACPYSLVELGATHTFLGRRTTAYCRGCQSSPRAAMSPLPGRAPCSGLLTAGLRSSREYCPHTWYCSNTLSEFLWPSRLFLPSRSVHISLGCGSFLSAVGLCRLSHCLFASGVRAKSSVPEWLSFPLSPPCSFCSETGKTSVFSPIRVRIVARICLCVFSVLLITQESDCLDYNSAPPLADWETLGKTLNIFVPQFLIARWKG